MSIRWALMVVFIAAGWLLAVTGPAQAHKITCAPGTTPIVTTTTNPHNPTQVITHIHGCQGTGGDDGDPGGGDGGDGGEDQCPQAPGGDCYGAGGVWFNWPGCYAIQLPDPAAGDPVWGGHDPADGSIWTCVDAAGGDCLFGSGPLCEPWFVPDGAQPPIDGSVVAAEAVGRMQLATLAPHTAPTPPDKSVVFVENWLWTDPAPWSNPLSMTVTVLGTSVRVTARVHHAEWHMGDGKTATCSTPGRAWVKGMSDTETTDCSYRYEKDGAFTVSGRLFYEVSWTCSGRCMAGSGTLGDYYPGPAASTQLTVVQRQTVAVN